MRECVGADAYGCSIIINILSISCTLFFYQSLLDTQRTTIWWTRECKKAYNFNNSIIWFIPLAQVESWQGDRIKWKTISHSRNSRASVRVVLRSISHKYKIDRLMEMSAVCTFSKLHVFCSSYLLFLFCLPLIRTGRKLQDDEFEWQTQCGIFFSFFVFFFFCSHKISSLWKYTFIR